MKSLHFFELPTGIAFDRRMKKIRRSVSKEFETPGIVIYVYFAIVLLLARLGIYCIAFDDDFVSDVAEEYGLGEDSIRKSITLLAENDFFDRKLFETEQIITSKELQESFKKICIRLHCPIDFSGEFSLISSPESSKSSANPSKEFAKNTNNSASFSNDFARIRAGEGEDRDKGRDRNRDERMGEECAGRSPQDGATRPHSEKFVFRDQKLNTRWKMLLVQPKWVGKNTVQVQLAFEKLQQYAEKSSDIAIAMIEHSVQGNYADIFDPSPQMIEELALRKKVAAKKGGLPAPPKEVERLTDFDYIPADGEPRCQEATQVRNAWSQIQKCIPESMENTSMDAKFHIENDTLLIILSPDISEWLKADSQRYRVLSEVYAKVEVKSSVLS